MASSFMGRVSLRSLIELIKGALDLKVNTNDARLTDARTPLDHASTHGVDGSDPISPALIGAVAKADVVNVLTSDETDKPLSAAQGKALKTAVDNLDSTTMKTATYDADGDGVVDNAAALGGVAAASYLTKVGLNDMKNVASGIVGLDENGLVPSDVLPSYVDDVIEGYVKEDLTAFYKDEAKSDAIDGESGKIYVDLSTGNTYRFGGTVFVKINDTGLTEATAEEVTGIWNEIMGA